MKKNISLKIDATITLNGFCWLSSQQITKNTVVILVHGMAEHIERYDEFASFLSTKGYSVYGYDQRGHKLSITEEFSYGYMSHINNFDALINDLFIFIEYVRSLEQNKKILVFGHSMGSFITQRAIQLNKSNFDYAILCGTGYNSTILLHFGKIIANLIILFKNRQYKSLFVDRLTFKTYNNKVMAPKTNYDWLNTQELEVNRYIKDKYCGGIFSVSFFKDFFSMMINIKKHFSKCQDIPLLLLSGKDDPVGNYSKNVFKLVQKLKKNKFSKVKYKFYDNCRHELLHEVSKDDVFNDVSKWIKSNEET